MRDDDARLLDMLLAAREAMTFVNGLTFREFEGDRMGRRLCRSYWTPFKGGQYHGATESASEAESSGHSEG